MEDAIVINAQRDKVFSKELPFFIQYHNVTSYPLHRHDFYEIEFVYGNGCHNVIDHIDHVINGKACFLYLPHTAHYYYSDNQLTQSCCNIAFSEVFVTAECMNLINSAHSYFSICIQENDMFPIEADIITLFKLYNSDSSLKKYLIKTRLETLILEICQCAFLQIAPVTGSGNTERLNMVLAYISQNFRKNITINELASIIYVSPQYFSAFFKKHFHDSYKSYITSIRMKHAMDLLIETKSSLKAIGNEVGYSSESNFIKAFVRFHGNHPNFYRNTL